MRPGTTGSIRQVLHRIGEDDRRVRPIALPHVVEQREHDRRNDSLFDAKEQHDGRDGQCDDILVPAFFADFGQFAKLDQLHADHEHDCREHGIGQETERLRQEEQNQSTVAAVASWAIWLRPPAVSTMAVLVGLPLTTNVPLSPAARLAAARPTRSVSSLHRSP